MSTRSCKTFLESLQNNPAWGLDSITQSCYTCGMLRQNTQLAGKPSSESAAPLAPERAHRKSRPIADRFWEKVDKSGECWLWLGWCSVGYGYIEIAGRSVGAHRWSYEQAHGPIPNGLQIDHLCRNRACVNPAHLEAVTSRINTLRGNGRTAQQARRTHCIRGHPFDMFNTRIGKRGDRHCRACEAVRHAAPTVRRRHARAVTK